MVAVVLPLRDPPRGGVPRWDFVESDYLLVVERDGVAGVAVVTQTEQWRGNQVWAGPGLLLGTIQNPSPEDALISFFSSSTGERHDVRRCHRRSEAWCITDGTGSVLARVTPRAVVVSRPVAAARPVAVSRPPEEDRTKPRLFARLANAFTNATRVPTVGCEIVGAGPAFDWVRHGLWIIAAALCDPSFRPDYD
jgi:hypothetical protein